MDAVSSVAIKSVDSKNFFTIRNLLLLPGLSSISRPFDNFLFVLVGHLQSVDSVLTRPDGECLDYLLLVDEKGDGTFLLPIGLEDWRCHTVREGGSNASHEIVFRVIPNLDLGQLNKLLFEHFLHFRLSRPFEVYFAFLVNG